MKENAKKKNHLNDDALGLELKVQGLGEEINVGLGARVNCVQRVT